mgnify:CR=1 FL=1
MCSIGSGPSSSFRTSFGGSLVTMTTLKSSCTTISPLTFSYFFHTGFRFATHEERGDVRSRRGIMIATSTVSSRVLTFLALIDQPIEGWSCRCEAPPPSFESLDVDARGFADILQRVFARHLAKAQAADFFVCVGPISGFWMLPLRLLVNISSIWEVAGVLLGGSWRPFWLRVGVQN